MSCVGSCQNTNGIHYLVQYIPDMRSVLYRLHRALYRQYQIKWPELLGLVLFVLFFNAATPLAAAKRLQERSLYMDSTVPGETTFYRLSFRYMTPDPIGSVDMLFCIDPIPHHPCVSPPGLDVSSAALTAQSGETGYSILSQSANHIVLSRLPTAISTSDPSTYTFSNIINPSDTHQAFAIRLRTHASTNATGPQVDFGSIRGQVTESIVIETQVPPMLIFCAARQVSEDCTSTDDTYYADMGELSADDTLTAQSQMAVGTNATAGFVITANGAPLSAGTSVINSLSSLAESQQGVNQFGINLVANSAPLVGGDPEGPWANANPTAEYSVPNNFKFVPGEVVAESPNVSLMRKFTVSYIVNSQDDIRPGVYTTTITYIASGRF